MSILFHCPWHNNQEWFNLIKVIRLIKFAISTKFKLKIKNVKNPHYIKNSCEKIVKKILKVNN